MDSSFQEEVIGWIEVWLPALGKHDFQIQRGVKKISGSELKLVLDIRPGHKNLEVSWDLEHSPLALEPFLKMLGSGQKLRPFQGEVASPDYAGCAQLLNAFTPKCILPFHASEILPVEKTSQGQVLLARMYLNHVLANHASSPLSMMPLLARGVAHWVLAEILSGQEEAELIVLRHQIGRMLDPAIFPLKTCEEEECRQIDAMAGVPQENRPPELKFLREFPLTEDLSWEKFDRDLNRLKATVQVRMDTDLIPLHRRPLWREELEQTQRMLKDIPLRKVLTPLQAMNRLLELSRPKRPDFIEGESRRIRRFAPSLYARLAYNAMAGWEFQRYEALYEQGHVPLTSLAMQKIMQEYTGAFHSWIQRDLMPVLSSEAAYEVCRQDWNLCSLEWLYQAFEELDSGIREDRVFQQEIAARVFPMMTARLDQQPYRLAIGYQMDAERTALNEMRNLQAAAMLGRRFGYVRRLENYVFNLDAEQFDFRDSLDRAGANREEVCDLAFSAFLGGHLGLVETLIKEYPARSPEEEVCYAYLLLSFKSDDTKASWERAVKAGDSADVREIRTYLAAAEISEDHFLQALEYLKVDWGKAEYQHLLTTSYLLQEMNESVLAAALSVHNLCQSQDEQLADSVLEWSESELSKKDLIRLMKAHCPVFSTEKSPEVSGWFYWDGERNQTGVSCNGKAMVSALEAWQQCEQDPEIVLDLGREKLNFSDRESFYDYLVQTRPARGEVLFEEGSGEPVFLVQAAGIRRLDGYRVRHTGQVHLKEGLGVAIRPELYAEALAALSSSAEER